MTYNEIRDLVAAIPKTYAPTYTITNTWNDRINICQCSPTIEVPKILQDSDDYFQKELSKALSYKSSNLKFSDRRIDKIIVKTEEILDDFVRDAIGHIVYEFLRCLRRKKSQSSSFLFKSTENAIVDWFLCNKDHLIYFYNNRGIFKSSDKVIKFLNENKLLKRRGL